MKMQSDSFVLDAHGRDLCCCETSKREVQRKNGLAEWNESDYTVPEAADGFVRQL